MSLPSTRENNIPLQCNVCHKKPTFSDVSHLLTHVSSKGHLSAYYKMKVKSSTDTSAKRIVDHYDEWYDEFNLDDLMRERMSQKEKKKRGSAGTSRTNAKSSRSASSTTIARSSHPARFGDSMSLLDPQLGHRLRSEPPSRSITPQSMYSLDAAGFQRALAHGMQNFVPHAHLYCNSPLIKQESFDSSVSEDDDEDEYDAYEYAPRRKAHSNRYRHQPSISTGSIDEMSVDELANDSTKLKGIYWPGMDMFDSATPEARRKRNQKKNISVLESLQATSEVVQPTECVFDADGVLRKEREITGNPDSEDSLIEGESEPEPDVPKKKKRPIRRSRPALVEKNVNSGCVLRKRSQSHHPSFTRKAKKPYFKEEDDDDLTYGPPRKRRTGLSIHRDNSGPDITFDHPAPMNYLTSAFHSPFQSTAMQPQLSYNGSGIPRTHARQQSWSHLTGGFRPSNTMPNQTFHNFSQYLTNTVGQMTQPGFQQHQMGMGSQILQNTQPLFPTHNWDFLGLDNEENGMLGNNSNPFQLNGEMTAANPLFFGSIKEDDDATISAAEDDH